MKKLIIIFLICSVLGCNKNEDVDNSAFWKEIEGEWLLYKVEYYNESPTPTVINYTDEDDIEFNFKSSTLYEVNNDNYFILHGTHNYKLVLDYLNPEFPEPNETKSVFFISGDYQDNTKYYYSKLSNGDILFSSSYTDGEDLYLKRKLKM